VKGHFAMTLFPSRRNASKTPCANRDPYPRPDSSCGTSVWSRARRLLVGDCERAVAEGHFKPAHCWIVPDTAAASGASRVSRRTATDCGFAVRSADLIFRRGGVRPAASPFASIVLKKSNLVPPPARRLIPLSPCKSATRVLLRVAAHCLHSVDNQIEDYLL
jgi:hypothetical protein